MSSLKTRILCAIFIIGFSVSSALAKQELPASQSAKHLSRPVAAKKPGQGIMASVRLTDGKNTIKLTRGDLGFKRTGNRHGRPFFSVSALKKELTKIAPQFAQPAINPRPAVYKGHIIVKPGEDARSLNIPRTTERIVRVIRRNPDAMLFRVVLKKSPPSVSPQKLRGINGVLSHFETVVSENDKRNHNIEVAVSRIDNTLLSPGQTFSLNKTVGERTHAEGFLTAHVFQNSKVVAGIGGVVSQVTGTLFNAAALAGLKIIEVHPHSRPVAYLPLGRDATVTDTGGEDLKFANKTRAPIFIDYRLKGNLLQATILGRRVPGRHITLRPAVQKLGVGKINAQLYRITKANGRVSKEVLFKHAYRWNPAEDAKMKAATR